MVSVFSFLRLQCRKLRDFLFPAVPILERVSSINQCQPLNDNSGNIKERIGVLREKASVWQVLPFTPHLINQKRWHNHTRTTMEKIPCKTTKIL